MKSTLEQVTASTSDLAQLLALSPRRMQQRVKARLRPTPGPDGHRVPAYLRLLQQPTRTANLSKPRQKLIEMQTQIRQVELREKKR